MKSKSPPKPSLISPLWLVSGCLLTCYGWLLPNTTIPWIAFHHDAWVACCLALVAACAVVRVKEPTPWHGITLGALALGVVPFLQLAFGLLPFAGVAWTSSAYVFGWLLAMLTGALWARRSAAEAVAGLFMLLGLTATGLAGQALYQWFELDGMGIWILPISDDRRAYANLGQPNQLGTMLVWGCVACGWALQTLRIRLPVAIAWWTFLMAAIATTQSRTAWLELAALGILACLWRRQWRSRRVPWVIGGLACVFALANAAVGPAGIALQLGDAVDLVGKTVNDVRPRAWAMLLDASMQRPWLGYGWTQISMAHRAVAPEHPEIAATVFSHAHNLFLDLVLFMGWPLGLAAGVGLCWWMWRQLRQLQRQVAPDAALLFMLVAALFIHAMLELPHQYAYMILPAGLAMGMLNMLNGGPPVLQTSRWVFAALCTGTLVLLAAVVIDYFEVEENYNALRFETARIGTRPPQPAPDVIVLTQLRELLRLGRFKIAPGMSDEQLQWVIDVANYHASLTNVFNVGKALALNNRPVEAQRAVTNMCATLSKEQCAIAKASWKAVQKEYPQAAAITGPR